MSTVFLFIGGKILGKKTNSFQILQQKSEEYGNHGNRVIAFAMKHFISKTTENFSISSNNYPINDLVFLGMASLTDPPKREVTTSIKEFKEAGTKIILVTGDPESSVLALAKQIGLISKDIDDSFNSKYESQKEWTIKTGDNLFLYTESDWNKVFQHRVILFANVNPTQKLQIVREAQNRKETVGYAGINTVSAVAAADIGIAFSDASTDMVQDVAGIILTDNKLSSISKGIEEGRQMFDNLCVSIAFTLTHLLPQICPILLTFIFEMPLALQPFQILFIGLIFDFVSSIALVWDNPETDVMKVPPRNRKKRLIPLSVLLYAYGFVGIAITLGCFGAYLSVFWYYGIKLNDMVLTSENFWDCKSDNLTVSSGTTFNANDQIFIRQRASAAWLGKLILSQMFHLILCKTQRTNLFQYKKSILITSFVVILQLFLLLIFIYVPPFQNILEIQPPPPHIWIFALIVGIYLFLFNKGRKYLALKWPNNKILKCLEF